ncbi:MAG: hypothetical protein M3094_08000, partial [Actinomycetia bacterium]|nr:hypothetical protein [Actinomycetes bacterium]
MSEDAPNIATLVNLLGRAGSPVTIAVGALNGDAPSVSLGFDRARTPLDWVRGIVSPAVRLSP